MLKYFVIQISIFSNKKTIIENSQSFKGLIEAVGPSSDLSKAVRLYKFHHP